MILQISIKMYDLTMFIIFKYMNFFVCLSVVYQKYQESRDAYSNTIAIFYTEINQNKRDSACYRSAAGFQ